MGKPSGSDEIVPDFVEDRGATTLLLIFNLAKEINKEGMVKCHNSGNAQKRKYKYPRGTKGISLLCMSERVYEQIMEMLGRNAIEYDLQDE